MATMWLLLVVVLCIFSVHSLEADNGKFYYLGPTANQKMPVLARRSEREQVKYVYTVQ